MALSKAFDEVRQGAQLSDDILKKALAALQGHDARTYTIRAHGLELSADGPEDHARLLEALKSMPAPALPTAPARTSPKLSARIALHLTDLKRSTSSGNVTDAAAALKIFLEITGDVPMHTITDAHARAFLDAMEAWPERATVRPEFRGLTAPQVLKKAKKLRAAGLDFPGLGQRSKDKYRDRLAAFFKTQVAAKKSSGMDESPLDGIKRAKNKQAVITRRAYTPEELAQIFAADTYVPWAESHPHRFWGPILAALSGARVNEIAQLYVDDVEMIAKTWGFHVRDNKTDKKIKNDNSRRFIVLHRSLWNLGFLDYVADVKKSGHRRLFPHLPYHQKSGYGDAMGDQFGRYLDAISVIGGFHHFRHTVASLLVNTGAPISIISSITGHGNNLPGAMGGYVHPALFQEQLAALNKISVPEIDALPIYKPGDFTAALNNAHALLKRREVNAAARARLIKRNKIDQQTAKN